MRIATFIICFLLPFAAFAQEASEAETVLETEAEVEPVAEEAAGEETPAGEEDLKAIEARLEELEARDKAREQELADLKQEHMEFEEEMALAALEQGVEDIETTEALRIFGFFDLTFAKTFYNKGEPYSMYIPDKSGFVLSNFNVFLQSQMTNTLEVLGELHFSFRPLGNETGWEVAGMPGTEYEREDTSVFETNNTAWFRLGGLDIVRIYLKYAPVDAFNVIAGRYLTPYGIWNIDHGSPVVIPARWPWMQIREIVPASQLGLQVYGRFFPGDSVYLDYAVTVSNGRGPVDTLQDLDENKGLGLKLAGTYQGKNAEISVGGYGYFGRYTDIKKVVHVNGISEHEGLSEDTPMLVELVETVSYDEYIVSGHLLAKAFGLRLQSEIVYKYVDMHNPPAMQQDNMLFAGGTGLETWFSPSHTSLAYYGLLAYELPLGDRLGPLRVTPYFLAEDCVADDSQPLLNMRLIAVGLNLKPSPYVVLKAEWVLGVPYSDKFESNINAISAQLAVSF